MIPQSTPPIPQSTRVHLYAGSVALLVFLALAITGNVMGRQLVARRFDALREVMAESKSDGFGDPEKSTYLDRLNSLGTTLQAEAFARPDQLPIYGSSELTRPIEDKAGLFFRNYPTGFAAYPVGRAGVDTFLYLQRMASLGEVTRGRRVAISLSPTWFFSKRPTEDAYLGNFSKTQALKSLLNPQFSTAFRRSLARRLLIHPASIEADPLLHFLVRRIVGGGRLDHAAVAVTLPLANLESAIQTVRDRFEVVLYIKRRLAPGDPERPPQVPSLDWDRLIADATVRSEVNLRPGFEETEIVDPTGKTKDQLFRESLEGGPEWDDLELLLRGLRELGMQPLVLSMPPQEGYYLRSGVTREALALYAERVHEIATRWGAEAQTFDDHTKDLRFQVGHGDHLSNRGWMYYNRVLDQFFHATPEQLSGASRSHHRHARVSSI